jgi:hypothetical protein
VAQLAAFLGVSESLIHPGNIIVFEPNGTGGVGFEHSTWRFTSGENEDVLEIPGDAAVTGVITLSAYKAFFGIGLDLSHVAEWPFVIIELSTVDPLAGTLVVTVTREAPPYGSPDPDAIGVLGSLHSVPVETTTWGGIKSLYRE